MLEAKKNEFIGVLEEIEESQPMRNGGSFNRIKIDRLWFSIFPDTKKPKDLVIGKEYLVVYFLSDSDFGRMYKNVISIEESSPNFYYTSLSKKLDEVIERLDKIELVVKAL